MKLNFKISEFNISGEAIPEVIADKILKHHIQPMQDVREELDYALFPSQKSGYRSKKWEIDHERSGTSQHVFDGKGAVDWTCNSFTERKKELLDSIIKHTEYTRIAIYEGFLHCDYKPTDQNKRQLFENEYDEEKEEWKWTFKEFV